MYLHLTSAKQMNNVEINIIYQHPLALVNNFMCRSSLESATSCRDRMLFVVLRCRFLINVTSTAYFEVIMSLSGRYF
jgi:hypothetical protein